MKCIHTDNAYVFFFSGYLKFFLLFLQIPFLKAAFLPMTFEICYKGKNYYNNCNQNYEEENIALAF